MKTPAEVVKENFWIGAKGGLLDLKHYLRMRESVWLFLYLLRNQTALNQAGEGVVNYGHPLCAENIAKDCKGIAERTIERWIARLRREGYIRTESHGQKGITFWIAKGKAKTRKVKVTADDALAMRSHKPPQMAEKEFSTPPDMAEKDSQFPPQMAEKHSVNSPQPFMDKALAEFFGNTTPKDSTSENLSLSQQTRPAKNAGPSFSCGNCFADRKEDCKCQKAKAKRAYYRNLAGIAEMPRTPSLQEKQKTLDAQAVAVMDKHSPGWRKKTGLWNSREERAQAYRILKEESAARRQASAIRQAERKEATV